MEIKQTFRETLIAIKSKFSSPPIDLSPIDKEIQNAIAELSQRQQDFDICSKRYSESAILYLKAAETRLNELLRERRSEFTKTNLSKEKTASKDVET